jgi:hypothetical protein
MSKVLEKQLYAAVLAVLNDRDSYYQSSVGKKGEYNHFNDGGKEAIMEFIETFAPLMLRQQEIELDARAKRIVLDELKK